MRGWSSRPKGGQRPAAGVYRVSCVKKQKKIKAKKFLRKKTKSKVGVGLLLPYPYLYYTLKKTKSPKVTDKIRATAKSKKVRTQKFENSKIINLKKLFKHFGSLFVTEISGLVIQENYLFY